MKRITFLVLFAIFATSILNAQNVGISNNIFTPRSYLHVHQPLAAGSLLQLTNSTSGNATNTVGLVFSVDGASYTMRNYQAGFITFQTNASDITFSDGTERMRVQAGGRVGIGTPAPHVSSLLHVNATDRGILIPNVALTATNAAGPVATPQTSLLVYNTATASTGATAVTPGFYYNAGTTAAPNWRRLMAGGSGGDGWLTTGNYGTTPANNWIGTNDAQDFVFKTGGVAAANERMRVTSAGNVVVNITAPLDAGDAFTSVVSPTFPTAIAAYGNGGEPIWAQQLNGNARAGFFVNSAANGAGTGGAILASSNQTGSATIFATTQNNFGYNNTTISVINAATGGTGIISEAETSTGTAIVAYNNWTNTGLVGFAIDARSNQTGGAAIMANLRGTSYFSNTAISAFTAATITDGRAIIAECSNASARVIQGQTTGNNADAIVGLNTGASNDTHTGSGVTGQTAKGLGYGVIGSNLNAARGIGVAGSGNNVGHFAVPNNAGAGGSFSGFRYGAFATQSSTTNGANYTVTGTYAGYIAWAENGEYHFGVHGYANGSSRRSGGVLGNHNQGQWGSLGYRTNANNNVGVYGSTAYDFGGGYMSGSNMAEGTGGAFYGGMLGAWARGDVAGLATAGEVFAQYNIGNTFTTGIQVEIVETEKANMAVYGVSSTELKMYADGSAQLTNGSVRVHFSDEFVALKDNGKPTITVTPVGNWAALYITDIDEKGFTVKDHMNPESNIDFSWIAIATRTDNHKTAEIPQQLISKEYKENMLGFMFNENIKTAQGKPAWWNGQEFRFDNMPDLFLKPAQRVEVKQIEVYEAQPLNTADDSGRTKVEVKELPKPVVLEAVQ